MGFNSGFKGLNTADSGDYAWTSSFNPGTVQRYEIVGLRDTTGNPQVTTLQKSAVSFVYFCYIHPGVPKLI